MIREIPGYELTISPDAYIAENATIAGAVSVASGASIWYGAVLRGDCGAIEIGERSSIQIM